MNAMTCDMEHGGCSALATISSNLAYVCPDHTNLWLMVMSAVCIGMFYFGIYLGHWRAKQGKPWLG